MKKIISLVTLIIAVCITASANEPAFTATKTGVGPIKLGLAFNKIPASVDKLYDTIKKEVEENEMDGDVTYVKFTLGDTHVMNAYLDHNNNIMSIEVLGSNIKSAGGIAPGTKLSVLFQKGGKVTVYNDGSYDMELNGYKYEITGITDAGFKKVQNSYMTGAEAKLTARDFGSDAVVGSFVIF
ncbi:hypothetical protein [Bacteroides sp. 519]|uniref:hypothetical protein n=1 Tax=Bacteroides sp. 519 TaxID=2302937 RepID=UPI0013D3AB14|nr:hypothetical protein [Bacteroides sp. 519]NDV59629.1 hypothetical protein [Bacteroides sp. 519]